MVKVFKNWPHSTKLLDERGFSAGRCVQGDPEHEAADRYALTKYLFKFSQWVNAALDDLCSILSLGKCKLFFFYKKIIKFMMENIYCAKLDNVQKYICDCESLNI